MLFSSKLDKYRTPPKKKPFFDAGFLDVPVYMVAYNSDRQVEQELRHVEQVKEFNEKFDVMWIHVSGKENSDLFKFYGKELGIEPQIICNSLSNISSLSKIEIYTNHANLITKVVDFSGHLETVPFIAIFSDKFLITFSEEPIECIKNLRLGIKNNQNSIRNENAEFLLYSLLVCFLEHYMQILEKYSDRFDELEAGIVNEPNYKHVMSLNVIKRDILILRRIMWRHRESVKSLMERNSKYHEKWFQYQGSILQIIDFLESYKETSAGLFDLYLSMNSHYTNETMKVLTVIMTIFAPLSFITSYYSMSMHMAEISWPWLRFTISCIMSLIASGVLMYFWKKGWLYSRKLKLTAVKTKDMTNE